MPWLAGTPGRAHSHANKMKHSPSALPGKGQSDGPSPRLLSRQSTPLPELGPRPRSSLSWPSLWGCSTGKVPIGGPFCDPSSRMGAVPHSGATAVSRLDSSAPELSPLISHYDHHYSHYDHCSQTPLSHTALTHHSRTHHSHTHRFHTMTISTAVSRRNGTKALPPACLPGARNLEPTQSQGLHGNRGAGLKPTIRGAERGEGLPKRCQVSVVCGRRKAVPTAQAHRQT